MQFLLVVMGLFYFSISNAQLTSTFQVLSFECEASGPQGMSSFDYSQNRDRVVRVTRNKTVQVNYSFHSAGVVGPMLQHLGSHHLTFSGGPLSSNQFLSFIFSTPLDAGDNKVSGSVFVVTQGGSVFVPSLGGVYPLGQFHCPTLVLR